MICEIYHHSIPDTIRSPFVVYLKLIKEIFSLSLVKSSECDEAKLIMIKKKGDFRKMIRAKKTSLDFVLKRLLLISFSSIPKEPISWV